MICVKYFAYNFELIKTKKISAEFVNNHTKVAAQNSQRVANI